MGASILHRRRHRLGDELDHGVHPSGKRAMIAARKPTALQIVELRQYTLRQGRRDVLIDLFERELVESQEAAGMEVIGQFRVVDHPDRFTWLRGFADMATRARAL